MITRRTLIEDIVNKHPSLVRPLREYGIVCIRCGEPVWGTLEQVAAEKGIEDIDGIIESMNRSLEGYLPGRDS
ncbi:MAG TPA: DUF1858 domain-containing protein [bacterium]|nr:DUF1858 domain-containing protein [bacterium]